MSAAALTLHNQVAADAIAANEHVCLCVWVPEHLCVRACVCVCVSEQLHSRPVVCQSTCVSGQLFVRAYVC